MKWSIFPLGSVVLSLLGIIMTIIFCKYIEKHAKLIKVLIFFWKKHISNNGCSFILYDDSSRLYQILSKWKLV